MGKSVNSCTTATQEESMFWCISFRFCSEHHLCCCLSGVEISCTHSPPCPKRYPGCHARVIYGGCLIFHWVEWCRMLLAFLLLGQLSCFQLFTFTSTAASFCLWSFYLPFRIISRRKNLQSAVTATKVINNLKIPGVHLPALLPAGVHIDPRASGNGEVQWCVFSLHFIFSHSKTCSSQNSSASF